VDRVGQLMVEGDARESAARSEMGQQGAGEREGAIPPLGNVERGSEGGVVLITGMQCLT
jgi:hypothetical protein